MEQAMQIMELSTLSKEEILRTLIKIFNESEIERFTLIIKQAPLKNTQDKQEFSLKVDEPSELTTRPKSSTIDRFYRTSHFLNLKKSMTTRRDNSLDSFDDQDLPQSPKELGVKLYRMGDFSEAAGIFQELRQEFPQENVDEDYRQEYKQILNHLGNCYFRLQQFDKAISIYKQLIREYSTDGGPPDERIKARIYNNLGCCFGKLGYDKLSMNSYNEALKIYSRYSATDISCLLYNIASIYFNCQMFDVSERYYHQAILEWEAKHPTDKDKTLPFQAYSKLSLTQIEQKKCKQALENLRMALKFADGGMGEPLQLLQQCAYVKQLEEKWQQALQFYQKMFVLYERENKNKGCIFESVANIYLQIGKMAEHKKYISLSLEEYRKDGNERKVSELANSWTRKKLH